VKSYEFIVFYQPTATSILVGLLLMGSVARGAPPPVLTNLFMTELVALLNENTPLQINLEMDTFTQRTRRS
jgi:hypothetical protein